MGENCENSELHPKALFLEEKDILERSNKKLKNGIPNEENRQPSFTLFQ